MAMSNAERQRKWRAAHHPTFCIGKETRREITMKRLYWYLDKHGPTTASALYKAFNIGRYEESKKEWRWLTEKIQENGYHGDGKLAPVTQIGDGKRNNAIFYRTSEDWPIERDWDKEQDLIEREYQKELALRGESLTTNTADKPESESESKAQS
jgi:hypothetical protein